MYLASKFRFNPQFFLKEMKKKLYVIFCWPILRVVVAGGDDDGGESFILVALVDGDDAVVLLDGGGAALARLAAAPAAPVVTHLLSLQTLKQKQKSSIQLS